MAEAHNHHYVPQAYLRSFADGVGRQARLYTVDMVTGSAFTTHVRNVGAKRDFNRIMSDELDPNAVESAYALFEDEAAGALRRVIAAESFDDPTDRRIILNLMALLVVRHPRIRSKIGDFMGEISQALMEHATATKERWHHSLADMRGKTTDEVDLSEDEYLAMRSFVREKRYDIRLHQNVHVGLEIETHDPVLQMMLVRSWTLRVAKDDAGEFIASDHPVFLLPLTQSVGRFGLGYGSPDGAAVFPLSPRLLLIGVFEGQNRTAHIDSHGIARMNGEIARHAHRQAFAHSASFAYSFASEAPRKGADLAADARFRKTNRV